jgi:hypothetical protein
MTKNYDWDSETIEILNEEFDQAGEAFKNYMEQEYVV